PASRVSLLSFEASTRVRAIGSPPWGIGSMVERRFHRAKARMAPPVWIPDFGISVCHCVGNFTHRGRRCPYSSGARGRAEVAEEVVAGRYAIQEELGRGASATVFRARDTVLQRPVALKVISSALAADPEF